MPKRTLHIVYINIIFLSSFFTTSFANEINILKKRTSKTVVDTSTVNELNRLSKSLFSTNPDKAIATAVNAKNLVKK